MKPPEFATVKSTNYLPHTLVIMEAVKVRAIGWVRGIGLGWLPMVPFKGLWMEEREEKRDRE